MIWREQKRNEKAVKSEDILGWGIDLTVESESNCRKNVTVVGLLCINSIMLLVGEREARLTDGRGRTKGSVKGGRLEAAKQDPRRSTTASH